MAKFSRKSTPRTIRGILISYGSVRPPMPKMTVRKVTWDGRECRK